MTKETKEQMKLKTLKDLAHYNGKYIHREDLRQEAIKDLINIYELEKILGIKLNDKNISILNKYIMWKFNITDGDLK